MSKKSRILITLGVVFLILVVAGTATYLLRNSIFNSYKSPNERLRAHTKEFVPAHITKVTQNVYVAVGYGLANSIMLVGNDGVIIVDTLDSAESAVQVKQEFDKISGNKPVKAIIYTHNHPDHTFGAKVFAGNDNPQIISFNTLPTELEKVFNQIQPIMFVRSMRMYGNLLPEADKINDGIGPALNYNQNATMAFVPPNHTFSDKSLSLTIAGIELVLMHAPGETDDQIFIWLPQQKVLLPGDNFYQSFPNLYTIRGTSARDVMSWVASLDQMRQLPTKYLVPSHTNPLKGESKIYQALTHYRDAIQFVHDQTLRQMNHGASSVDIAAQLQLPASLAKDPNLQPYYGTVAWSSRGIYDQYLGWFSGKARDLSPLTSVEQAQHMANLVGGVDELAKKASEAQAAQDNQWALQLADETLLIQPNNQLAKNVKISALTVMANATENANAHNYYLTEALETGGQIQNTAPKRYNLPNKTLEALPLKALFNTFGVRLLPDKIAGREMIINFSFPDVNQAYSLAIRDGIVEVSPTTSLNEDVSFTASSIIFKQIMTGKLPLQTALQQGEVTLSGDKEDFTLFLNAFEPL